MIGKKCDSNQFMLIWLVLIFVHLKKDQNLWKKMKMKKDVLKTCSKFWKKTTTRWKVQEQLRRQFHLEVNFLIDFWCEVGFAFSRHWAQITVWKTITDDQHKPKEYCFNIRRLNALTRDGTTSQGLNIRSQSVTAV